MQIGDLQLIRPIPDDASLIRTIVARVSRLMLVYGVIALVGSIAALALTVGGGMAGIFILLLTLLLGAKKVYPVIRPAFHRVFAHWITGHALQRDVPATELPPTDTSSSSTELATRMAFDHREWVNDLVTGAITGVCGGVVGAMFVPDPPYLDLMVGGGVTGLVTGICVLPLKYLLNRQPSSAVAPEIRSMRLEGTASKFAVLSAFYATAVATGALAICLGIIAWANGTSFVEYYQYVFPRLRGGTPGIHIPALGYVAFVLYIGVAALVAIRKRWAARGLTTVT